MNIFLSYHTPDRALGRGLATALKEQLPGADVFFDVSRLRHGYHWQRALYDAIGKSDAFIILVGNKLGNWQTAEYFEAHDRKVNNPDKFVLLPIITGDRSERTHTQFARLKSAALD